MAKQKRIQLKLYDKLLKSFQYREALDAALASARPEVVSSLVEELAARSGLPAALGKSYNCTQELFCSACQYASLVWCVCLCDCNMVGHAAVQVSQHM